MGGGCAAAAAQSVSAMNAFLAPLLLALILGSGPGPDVTSNDVPVAHDFHVSYSRLAVEGSMVVVRIRLFQDDLGEALGKREGHDVVVDISPEQDSLFQAYFNETFVMTSGEEVLTGTLVGSGEEVVGKQPMWWYLLEFQASAPIKGLNISQRILSEVFEDQKNIVQIQHFPSEKTFSLYCVADSWEYDVSF